MNYDGFTFFESYAFNFIYSLLALISKKSVIFLKLNLL